MNRADKLRSLQDPSYASTLALRELFGRVETMKGEPGKTPVRGVDYFTEADVQQIVRHIVSLLAPTVHGKDGRHGRDGKDGINGKDGKDGVDGKHGKDGQDGRNPDVKDVIPHVLKALKATPLSTDHIAIDGIEKIKTLTDLVDFLKRGGFRGGAGSSTATVATYYNDTVSGTINGTNKVFTVPNTITAAIFCSLGNSNYQANVDYTVSGKTITFTNAPDASLAGQPFWLAHT